MSQQLTISKFSKPAKHPHTIKFMLTLAKEIELETSGEKYVAKFGNSIDGWYKCYKQDRDEYEAAKTVLCEQISGRCGLYKHFQIITWHDEEMGDTKPYMFDEKLEYYKIFKEHGLVKAEKYAKQLIMELKPELLSPLMLIDGTVWSRTEEEEKIYALYDRVDKIGNMVDFQRAVTFKIKKIKKELGAEFQAILEQDGRSDLGQFIAYPYVSGYANQEDVNTFLALYTYAIDHSKTLQKIQADIYKVNKYTEDKFNETKTVYRGGSINEVYKMEENDGEIGHHKRGVYSMRNQDFTSTSIFPITGLAFTSHDYVPRNDGILFEFDVSDVPSNMAKPVKYDLRGMVQKNLGTVNSDACWPLEQFAMYSPYFIKQAEIHLKKGAKPVVRKTWISPKLGKIKQKRVKKILTAMYPNVQIFEDFEIHK